MQVGLPHRQSLSSQTTGPVVSPSETVLVSHGARVVQQLQSAQDAQPQPEQVSIPPQTRTAAGNGTYLPAEPRQATQFAERFAPFVAMRKRHPSSQLARHTTSNNPYTGRLSATWVLSRGQNRFAEVTYSNENTSGLILVHRTNRVYKIRSCISQHHFHPAQRPLEWSTLPRRCNTSSDSSASTIFVRMRLSKSSKWKMFINVNGQHFALIFEKGREFHLFYMTAPPVDPNPELVDPEVGGREIFCPLHLVAVLWPHAVTVVNARSSNDQNNLWASGTVDLSSEAADVLFAAAIWGRTAITSDDRFRAFRSRSMRTARPRPKVISFPC